MKRIYPRPSTTIVQLESHQCILQGSGVYTDDPQRPGAALSRRHGGWNDIWDEEEE